MKRCACQLARTCARSVFVLCVHDNRVSTFVIIRRSAELKDWEKDADRQCYPGQGNLCRSAKGPVMRNWKFKVAAAVALTLTGISRSAGQHSSPAVKIPATGQAQGSLAVTLTVVSSVGLVTGPDGRQRVVVANAAAASDNVSSLQYVRLTDVRNSGGSTSQPHGTSSREMRKK
jgi:hypothetical protein